MKTVDRLIAHYGGKDETCAALSIHAETLRLWLRDGIPLGKALFIEEKSARAVSAEEILQEARAAA